MPLVLARLEKRQPAALVEMLREQWERLSRFDEQIDDIEKRLKVWAQQDKACQKILKIPGVGVLIATAAVATMGDCRAFRNGRELAAYLGLVPGQTGTGGRVKLLGISKRGDKYLRTLLVHGARSVMLLANDPGEWAKKIKERRPTNVAVVAQANKLARTIWAIIAHDREWQKDYISVRPY